MTNTCLRVEGYKGRYLSPANLSPFSSEQVQEATLFEFDNYWWVLWESSLDLQCVDSVHPFHEVHLNGLVERALKKVSPIH